MPALKIRFSKKSDGTSVISCTREDGSTTWERRRFDFFPLHDLTHLAVESTLGIRGGFYGLLLDGWRISDFGDQKIPADSTGDAILTESIVGLLDQELGTGIRLKADDFNSALVSALEGLGVSDRRSITAEELVRLREMRLELFGKWARTDINESLDLDIHFDS